MKPVFQGNVLKEQGKGKALDLSPPTSSAQDYSVLKIF